VRACISAAIPPCSTSTILRGLHGLGYTAYPFDPLRQGEQARRAGRRLFRQLFIAGLSMMQVMMYAIPVYMTHEGIDPDMMALMRWASLFLTIPAVFYSALPFFTGAGRGCGRGPWAWTCRWPSALLPPSLAAPSRPGAARARSGSTA
jgi:cation transport ATPase